MLKKILRIAAIMCLLFSSFDLSVFAQTLEPAPAPVFLPPRLGPNVEQKEPAVPEAEGSAPFQDPETFVFDEQPPWYRLEEQLPPSSAAPVNPFDDPKAREKFKLFDTNRYSFIQDDTPMMLPPDTDGEYEDADNYYRYSRTYLENIMASADGGAQPVDRGIDYFEILNPSLMLPIFGTTISLTGRKTFGFNYKARKYKTKQTVSDRSFSSFDFDQEMQLKLQGKISDRIFVDIDYDDQRQDAQNISVSYRGKGEEFVQSADFGDIELALPGTEFLSYSKQVFGAKMHLKYGNANLRLIGSQSKGESKSKQFRGDSVFDTVNIKDIQYIRRKYYDLTFDNDPSWTFAIVPGSEKVYLDDHTNHGFQVSMWAQDLHRPASVYPTTGGNAAFRLLTRGVDYVIDYNRNILIFNLPLRETDVVAIDYTNTNGAVLSNAPGGTPGIPKLIKTPNDRPIEDRTTEIGFRLEIKRYYDIGARQLSRDNGQGNFLLRLLESDGRETCAPADPRGFCKFSVDYDKGIFELMGLFPDASGSNPDPNIYGTTPVSPFNRYFFVQFSSAVRTYFLEPDVVVQSETVKVNGATMARNRDYYVDYASGFITFYNENLIGPGSIIDVTYETAAGTGSAQSALLGARFNYDFTKNITFGASILQEAGTEPKRVPNVGALSSTLTAMEADLRATDVKIADGVRLSLGAEAAQSIKDENLFGYAMIDNLEETKETVKASTVFTDWIFSSNPNGRTAFLNALHWDSQEIKVLDINPSSAARADATQNVLTIDYDFTLADNAGFPLNDELSLVFPISRQGADFTNKTLLELSISGDTPAGEDGPLFNVTFGTVNERSDNYSYIPPGFTEADIFPACSKYYTPGTFYVPKTEDLRCTGALTPAEDSGWLFVNPDGTYQRYDPFVSNVYNRAPQPNGRIDTQDLNGNGIYDSEDLSVGGSFGYANTNLPQQTLVPGNVIDFNGWRQFQLEVDLSDANRWNSIRQMRITFKKSAGGNPRMKGTIKIANLSASGSTWKPLEEAPISGEIIAYGINNVDNPLTYKPIFSDTGDAGQVFRTLYGSVNDMRAQDGSNNVREQALALQYNFSATTSQDLSVQRNFSVMDFSQHREFRFLLYNNNTMPVSGTSFYLRIGVDPANYAEIEIPLDYAAGGWVPGQLWHLYTLKLIDTNDDGIPERWENASKYPATVNHQGYVNFNRVGTIRAGLRSGSPGSIDMGEVWLNEIFLADSKITIGTAYTGDARIDIENWLEAGGKYTYMDDKFQTPVAVPTKQKNTKEDYFLKFKRIKNLPVTATYARNETITPSALGYDRSNTVSLLDQGNVERDRGVVKAEYTNPDLPRMSAEYSFENADFDLLQRNDARRYYSAGIDYISKKREPLIKGITAGASLANNKINYGDDVTKASPSAYYNTDEQIQSYNLRVQLQPWSGASIVPSYNLSLADETRRTYDPIHDMYAQRKYSKNASQNAAVNASMRINRWLAPIASYTINTRENNNLSPLSYKANNNNIYDFDIGEVKSFSRMSEGNLGLNLNGKEVLPGTKIVSGLTLAANYKMQDGDSWENVDDSFNSLDKLWIRSSMGLNAPYTYRSRLTLRDTYSANMRWMPFREYAVEGRLAPLKNLSVMNSFTKSYQTTEDLGSSYETHSTSMPDLVLVIDDIEKFFVPSIRFISGTNLKLKYNSVRTETLGSELKEDYVYGADFRFLTWDYFDTTLAFNQQTMDKTDTKFGSPLETYLRRDLTAQTSFNIKKVRFTPKFTYLYDTRSNASNTLINDAKELVPSLNIRADFNLPFAIRLPFITRQYLVTNRVIWTTNVSYSQRRSFTVTENRDLFDVNTNFDYEVSRNIRLSFTGGVQTYKHLYIAEESYIAYNLGTLLTIQF